MVILTQRQRNWINFEFGTQRSPKTENSRSLFCIVIYCCPLFLYEAIIVKKYEATFCIHWAFAFISNLTLFFYPTCFANSSHDKKERKNTLAFNVFVAFSTYYTSQKVHHAFEIESKTIVRFQGVSVYKLCIVVLVVIHKISTTV